MFPPCTEEAGFGAGRARKSHQWGTFQSEDMHVTTHRRPSRSGQLNRLRGFKTLFSHPHPSCSMAGVEGKGTKQSQRETPPPNSLCPLIKHGVMCENKSLFPRAMNSLHKHLPGGFSGLKNSRAWCLEVIYLCVG